MIKVFSFLLIFIGVCFSTAMAHDDGHSLTHTMKTGPKIEFSEEEFNFGKILQGEEVTHVFTFYNRGDEELIIKNIETSCGCTAVLATKDVLQPGEKGLLTVIYDSTARDGDVERKVFVDSNDPVHPEMVLMLYASVDASMHDAFKAGIGLFSKKCNSCHGEPAEGLAGKELFDAVCTFCHGYKDDESRAVTFKAMNGRATRNIVVFGIPGTEMPGFGKSEKGPLDEKQIDSLLNYINK